MTGEYNCHCEMSFHFPFTKKNPEQNLRFCPFCQTLAYSLTTDFVTTQHRQQCTLWIILLFRFDHAFVMLMFQLFRHLEVLMFAPLFPIYT